MKPLFVGGFWHNGEYVTEMKVYRAKDVENQKCDKKDKEIEWLKKALWEYGCHLDACPSFNKPFDKHVCDCGFEQALKEGG